MRAARRFAIGFFLVYVAAVIFPAVVPFRGPRPFIFGMPLAMVWAAAWIVASFFVLLLLDRAYSTAERASDAGPFTPDTADADSDTAGGRPGPPASPTER